MGKHKKFNPEIIAQAINKVANISALFKVKIKDLALIRAWLYSNRGFIDYDFNEWFNGPVIVLKSTGKYEADKKVLRLTDEIRKFLNKYYPKNEICVIDYTHEETDMCDWSRGTHKKGKLETLIMDYIKVIESVK